MSVHIHPMNMSKSAAVVAAHIDDAREILLRVYMANVDTRISRQALEMADDLAHMQRQCEEVANG